MIVTGDCVEVMAGMEPESVDAIVTDPPYGLEFMGQEWDRLARPKAGNLGGFADGNKPSFERVYRHLPRMQEWHHRWATEALRVAKPGAFLLAFGGTRTYHRLVCAIEDAGWIIRDCLVWAYASGFPKSKALLKPAWEPIVMARKPGPLRELAIDACRLPVGDEQINVPQSDPAKRAGVVGTDLGITRSNVEDFQQAQRESIERTQTLGRWPANLILTDPIFDGDVEGIVGGGMATTGGSILGDKEYADIGYHGNLTNRSAFEAYGDTGTYSRFFLIPKASRSEREPVFGDVTPRRETAHRRTGPMDTPFLRGETVRRNPHPTVKPIDLMRHLVRLITPRGGTVLDPFLGSGTTGIAAEMEGFDWIGIEREPEYVKIAEARLMGVQRGLGLTA